MVKLGTLRAVYTHTWAEIAENDSKSEQEICRDGDKYEFAIDGIIVNFDERETVDVPLDSEILIDFSIYPTDKAEVILADFPYSCRGTRNNPFYIPLSKEVGFPMLPVNKKFYYKISNTDTDANHAIQGVAFVVFGYPVLGA